MTYSVLKRKLVVNTNDALRGDRRINQRKYHRQPFLSRLFSQPVGALSTCFIAFYSSHKVNNTLQMLRSAKVGDVLTISSENIHT